MFREFSIEKAPDLRRLRGQIATAMKDGGGAANVVKRGLLWLESDLPPEPDVLLSARQDLITAAPRRGRAVRYRKVTRSS